LAEQGLGADRQVFADVVEPFNMATDILEAGQEAWPAGAAGDQGAMQGHGLGSVFNPAEADQARATAQRVVAVPMGAAEAGDLAPVPSRHAVEQHHLASVRQQGGDGLSC